LYICRQSEKSKAIGKAAATAFIRRYYEHYAAYSTNTLRLLHSDFFQIAVAGNGAAGKIMFVTYSLFESSFETKSNFEWSATLMEEGGQCIAYVWQLQRPDTLRSQISGHSSPSATCLSDSPVMRRAGRLNSCSRVAPLSNRSFR
jgi:hypothetical protein